MCVLLQIGSVCFQGDVSYPESVEMEGENGKALFGGLVMSSLFNWIPKIVPNLFLNLRNSI